MRIIMIGATGMLGRPVARQLVDAGMSVRAMVRNVARARDLLPAACELMRGDLREATSVARALDGADAAYLNLAPPMAEGRWNAELQGSKLVARLARPAGLKRLVRLSALGVPEGADAWWVARHKAEADDAVAACGVPFTIFRPDWFCESLALFRLGPFNLRPSVPNDGLRWIAGDDYGRQVVAALHTEAASNRIYGVQGPEPVPLQEALRRFRRAMDWKLLTVPLPRWFLRFSGLFAAQARYLHKLLDLTYAHTLGLRAEETWAELGRPTMTIEDYAVSITGTGRDPEK